jgi:hypothetical protein
VPAPRAPAPALPPAAGAPPAQQPVESKTKAELKAERKAAKELNQSASLLPQLSRPTRVVVTPVPSTVLSPSPTDLPTAP